MPPQLHVVYCLTSSGGDLYEAMTRVSLATLRLTNPSARVTIACDQQTHQALQASGSQLFHEADAVRGFPTPDGPPTYRNRYVKTQLGRLIDGPFLFLDSDTVVRKPLTPLLDLHCDIAAAPNHSRDTLAEQIWSEDKAHLQLMNWPIGEPYMNGGVIWYQGSQHSGEIADSWHSNWHVSVTKTGRMRDQTAFNFTIHNHRCLVLAILPHAMNAQYHCNPSVSNGARIWHAHWSGGNIARSNEVFSQVLLKYINQTSTPIANRDVKRLALSHSPVPWGGSIREKIAMKLRSAYMSSVRK